MKIRTEYQFFGWVAYDDDTYDGPGSFIGSGYTESAAIEDFQEQLACVSDSALTRQPSKTTSPQSCDAMPTASPKNSGEPPSSETSSDDELSRDAGSVDLPDELGDWKDDYADAVCISRTREL